MPQLQKLERLDTFTHRGGSEKCHERFECTANGEEKPVPRRQVGINGAIELRDKMDTLSSTLNKEGTHG